MNTFLKYAFFLIPLLAQAQDCGTPDPKWKNCFESKDCMLIQDSCNHLLDPVNRSYKIQATKHNKCLSKYVDCVKVLPEPIGAVKCIRLMCTTEPFRSK